MEKMHMKIEKYNYSKWLDKWVLYNNGEKFEWLISTKAPFVKYKPSITSLRRVTNSGLSTSAKVVFYFLLQNRFGDTPVCLYGNGNIAKMVGLSEPTVKKSLGNLLKPNVICKMKIFTGNNVSYQYYIKPEKEWVLPPNKYGSLDYFQEVSSSPVAVLD